jgi:hypothetical protein
MQVEKKHPCELIYAIGAQGKVYGDTTGTCRITGKVSRGVVFNKWVKDTFTDHAWLKPGDIISNEALFCFDEQSEILQQKTAREKAQRFRTYSHIIDASGAWHCLTKANKKLIFDLICNGAPLVCLTDSGQKHLLFKHRNGMWQLDDIFLIPDLETLKFLHEKMMSLIRLGFSQAEVISGNYLQYRIQKAGMDIWRETENILKRYRGIQIFNFTAWLLYSIK